MNFTASIYRREDRNWGSLMPDGSINGMISSLVKGEADLLATSLTMKPYRHSGCDFLVGTHDMSYILFSKTTI